MKMVCFTTRRKKASEKCYFIALYQRIERLFE